eukprot:COSAG01_NODE_2256_length_8067_cov_5.797691_6_plen_58_part_00
MRGGVDGDTTPYGVADCGRIIHGRDGGGIIIITIIIIIIIIITIIIIIIIIQYRDRC